MPTREERVQIMIMEDAMTYGVVAAEGAEDREIPPGIAAYTMGFHNALLLQANVPEAAAAALATFMAGMSTHEGEFPNAAANQQAWFEEWRKALWPEGTVLLFHPLGYVNCPDFPGMCEGHPMGDKVGT